MSDHVHALALRERFGDALEKVIMGLYSGGVRIVAGTDAGIDNCPYVACLSGLEALAMVGLPAVEILDAATLRAARALDAEYRPAPDRGRRPAGPLPGGPPPGGPAPAADPAVAGPAAALATPAGPTPR